MVYLQTINRNGRLGIVCAGEAMLRGAAFLLLACWIASDSGASMAQPGSAGQCSAKAIDVALRRGETPDVRGCDLGRLYNSLRELNLDPTIVREADPQTPSGTVSKITVGDNAATIHVSTGPPPPQQGSPTGDTPLGGIPPPLPKPRFSISAAPTVQEGGKLTVTVRRDGNDDQIRQIRFITDRTELLKAAIPPLFFAPDSSEQTFDVDTVWGEPGDSDNVLRIQLATDQSADVGDPATVSVTDAPANNYLVESPTKVMRGDAIEFTIKRGGPLRPDVVEYQFVQDGAVFQPDGVARSLRFDEGDGDASVTLPANTYLACGSPPVLTLQLDTPVSGSASFLNEPDARCGPEQPKFPPPWWPIPVVVIGIAAIGYVIKKLIPPPAPALYPTWEVEAGLPVRESDPPTIPGWPKFSSQTEIEWGGASLPEPLPPAEEENG